MKNIKNKILLLSLTTALAALPAFAIQEGKVISDSTSKKELMDAFGNVNQYTNSFFTPHVVKSIDDSTDKKKGSASMLGNNDYPAHGSILPVKKLRLSILNKKRLKQVPTTIEEEPNKNQAILDCDYMEYLAPLTELQATGNVVIFFPQNNSTIKADKIVYNQTSNLIKATGNVVLINDGKEIFGDYMNMDMNEENGFLDNPTTDIFSIHAKAKKGYMYGDKIIQEQGNLTITKKTPINVISEMFGPNLDYLYVNEKDKSYYKKDSHGEKFKIKTDDLIINSKKEHDTLTLKHAEIYFDNKKIGTIPSITMHTNKNQDYVEANFPEIGTMTNMGLFAGPGFVIDTPKGTTLKLVPMLNYDQGEVGWGSLAKFKSATNKTDMGYGTTNKTFVMRGLQKLDDNLYFQYGANSYMDDWFMGFRMPKLLGELVYQDTYTDPTFILKDRDMSFTQRVTAAYVQDGSGSGPLLDGEGSIGTMRFKYMAEVAQTLFKYNDPYTSPINARFEIAGQGSTAIYGTGDTQNVVRIGPRLHTQYKNWMQDVGYFLSAYSDQTPLKNFDQYMYGRSNVYLRESYRICKYLTMSWFGSLNLAQDSWDGKMLQENGFYFAIGPDDVKLNIGYDTVRQQSFVTMAMHLDAKGTNVEYKRMTIKNPETLGKNPNGENNQQSFSSPQQENIDETGRERAQVIELKEAL